MVNKNTGAVLARRVLACVLSATMVFALTPATAFAGVEGAGSSASDGEISSAAVDNAGYGSAAAAVSSAGEAQAASLVVQALAASDSDGTVSCSGGWVLNYSISDDGVTITGVDTEPNSATSLVIPSSIDGTDVVAIGDSAFASCDALTTVELPDTVSSIGLYAFMASSVTSINIPAAVERIAFRCFRDCTFLTDVNFEGDSLRYISQQAFYGATSLAEIEIPLLTDVPSYDEAVADGITGNTTYTAAIGNSCFEYCESLALIVFDGPVVQDPVTYFGSTNCLTYCADELTIVCKCATVDIPSGTGGAGVVTVTSAYHTIDFYASEEDAENLENGLGSVTVKTVNRSLNGTNNVTSSYLVQLMAFVYGTEDYSEYIYEGSIPTCPDGKVWGFVGTSGLNSYTYMSGSYQAVAVDPEDVSYGWVGSPSLDEFRSTSSSSTTSTGMNSSSDYASIYMETDGSIPELSEFAAYATDGTELEQSAYTLVFEQAEITYTYTQTGGTSTTWTEIDVDDITETGTYRVHAVGTGDYADSETATVSFYIVWPSPDVTTYSGSSISAYLGSANYATATDLEDTPAYNVIAPSSDWRNQLLAAGFAGAGSGLVLIDCGDDYSSKMVQAFVQSGASSCIIIGSEDDVALSADISDEACLADLIVERCSSYTRYGANTTTAQELATSAIGTFKASRWGAEWGEVAVVASADNEYITEAAAQYVYQNAARVFFLQDDGTLASDDLTTLASSDITQIVLVGDTSCVSSSVASSIKSATGTTPTRILQGSTATTASIGLAEDLVEAGMSSYSTVVIADATDSANVATAAVMAEVEGGVMLTCRTTADAKAIEAFFEQLIATEGLAVVEDLRLIGNFDFLDDVSTCFSAAWEVDAANLNTTGAISLSTGDTFEVSDVVYEITGSKTACIEDFTVYVDFEDNAQTITYNGTTYTLDPYYSFPDVVGDSWYYTPAYYVAYLGIMTGYSSGSNAGDFGVTDTLTRAQLVTVLWRYLCPDEYAAYTSSVQAATKGTTRLSDGSTITGIDSNTYWTAAANWAIEQGIVTGYERPNGTYDFAGDDKASFEQVATILARMLTDGESEDYDTSVLSSSIYTDGSKVDSWAASHIAWCIDNGVLSGNDNGNGTYTIAPKSYIARERFATLIWKAMVAGVM